MHFLRQRCSDKACKREHFPCCLAVQPLQKALLPLCSLLFKKKREGSTLQTSTRLAPHAKQAKKKRQRTQSKAKALHKRKKMNRTTKEATPPNIAEKAKQNSNTNQKKRKEMKPLLWGQARGEGPLLTSGGHLPGKGKEIPSLESSRECAMTSVNGSARRQKKITMGVMSFLVLVGVGGWGACGGVFCVLGMAATGGGEPTSVGQNGVPHSVLESQHSTPPPPTSHPPPVFPPRPLSCSTPFPREQAL